MDLETAVRGKIGMEGGDALGSMLFGKNIKIKKKRVYKKCKKKRVVGGS